MSKCFIFFDGSSVHFGLECFVDCGLDEKRKRLVWIVVLWLCIQVKVGAVGGIMAHGLSFPL